MAEFTEGMNISEVRRLAADLERSASQVDKMLKEIGNRISSSTWVGKDCHTFKTQWWPQQSNRLRMLADDLRGYGKSARTNADDQTKASGAGPERPGVYIVSGQSYDRKVYSGVVGRGVDGSMIDVLRMSDGTYRVRVSYSSAFEANGGDALKLASLALPEQKALASVAGIVGGSVTLLGIQHGWEFSVPNQAAAERIAGGLRREAGELGGLDGLNRGEIQSVVNGEIAKGTQVTVVDASVEHPGVAVTGSIGKGPFTLEGSHSANTLIHSGDGSNASDTLRSLGVVDAEVGPGSVRAALSNEITVVRDSAGEVVGLDVRSTVSPTAGVGVSSSDVVDALTSGSKSLVPGLPGYDNITGFLNADTKVSTGVVTATTTHYDLSSSQGQPFATMFGGANPNASLSADDIRRAHDAIVESGVGGSRTVEVYNINEIDKGGRYISYESRTTDGATSLVARYTDSF